MVNEDFFKLKDVFRRPLYISVAAVLSIAAFSAYALLLNYNLVLSAVQSGSIGLLVDLVPALVVGYFNTTTTFSAVMSLLVSLAVGINFALVAFRLVEMSALGKEGAGSLGGMAVAVLAPACPACATTIFAFTGLSSFLAVLPFKGTELKVLALLLLIGSALYITRQIDKEVCETCQI
ncbi:MAG: hypothetical protein SVV03_03160 [Candidatus Nanohaloarchaea archaeon]|nr:hypothetical protein [Candidatus Nanohaloarchaea archaeon]